MKMNETREKADLRLNRAVEERLLSLLKETFRENLSSVLVYGSYASGSFTRGVSDINVLIVLDRSDPGRMEDLGRRGSSWIRRNNVTPLILTRSEFLSSADVFPMEYLDIQAHHILLHGEDATRSLTLLKTYLRHQLEDRLRGMVASLRKLLVLSAGRERLVARYLKEWMGPYGALFRGLLRLKGVSTVPYRNEALLRMVNEEFNLDTAPFSAMIELKKGARTGARKLAHALLASLESLIVVIDGMNVKA